MSLAFVFLFSRTVCVSEKYKQNDIYCSFEGHRLKQVGGVKIDKELCLYKCKYSYSE